MLRDSGEPGQPDDGGQLRGERGQPEQRRTGQHAIRGGRDDEKPSITCPAPVTQNADAVKRYATVASLGSPTTADNCAVNEASLSSDVHANSLLAALPISVTWTVSDIHGNSASCTQTVT